MFEKQNRKIKVIVNVVDTNFMLSLQKNREKWTQMGFGKLHFYV